MGLSVIKANLHKSTQTIGLNALKINLSQGTLVSSVLVLEHVLQIFLQGIYSINILYLE